MQATVADGGSSLRAAGPLRPDKTTASQTHIVRDEYNFYTLLHIQGQRSVLVSRLRQTDCDRPARVSAALDRPDPKCHRRVYGEGAWVRSMADRPNREYDWV